MTDVDCTKRSKIKCIAVLFPGIGEGKLYKVLSLGVWGDTPQEKFVI